MDRGVNKVILIGNLGQDPDTRFTQGGSPVSTLSVATDESYKDKQTGQMVPKTEWHRVVLFNRLAEIAQEYLKKGSKVYIEGRLQTRKWQNQTGQDQYTTEIVGNELQMLDSRPGGAPHPADQSPAQQAPAQSSPQAQASPMAGAPQGYAQQQAQNYQQGHPPQPAADDFDDDIPF